MVCYIAHKNVWRKRGVLLLEWCSYFNVVLKYEHLSNKSTPLSSKLQFLQKSSPQKFRTSFPSPLPCPHLQAVIDCNVFPLLIDIMNSGAVFKTRKEAAWAILNATSGGTNQQIRLVLKHSAPSSWF